MKLSPAAEFAVRGAVVLAKRHGQGPINLDTICKERDLPKQYLAKLFASLARAGLLTPVRGKHGGYLLARDPAEITILEIIEIIEGPIMLNYCQHVPPKCDDFDCAIRDVWRELQSTVRSKLDSVTLQDCLDCYTAPKKR